ncbi:hypothetical protein TNIN_425471 [Trichonephila inaurata madagascariensis]|uniref:Uncharacterized protein n=1 Tax=Trichonephila inaurata madagascariensis TaxID=2747483 RepID=A0A8X6XT78_9ARAC|nr:hypothetical protein TNIN_425471 [Trichonephila inaurata madagascariensis]
MLGNVKKEEKRKAGEKDEENGKSGIQNKREQKSRHKNNEEELQERKRKEKIELDEIKNSIVCEVQTFKEGSCPDIEGSIDAGNIENEVRSNLKRLKAEEEAKTVEEGRKMEEERRMNERIALEEEMRLKTERWLVEEQMRHVQEEHKTSLKDEEQKFLQEVSAEDEMLEEQCELIVGIEKEETSVDVIKDKDDLNPIILRKERMDFDEEEIEEEKPKLPKRKLKNLSRKTVAELQQKVNFKASSNILLIPLHRSVKRKYSQDKGGIEKLAWKLPDFI